jgi:hypothetical protein
MARCNDKALGSAALAASPGCAEWDAAEQLRGGLSASRLPAQQRVVRMMRSRRSKWRSQAAQELGIAQPAERRGHAQAARELETTSSPPRRPREKFRNVLRDESRRPLFHRHGAGERCQREGPVSRLSDDCVSWTSIRSKCRQCLR